MDFVNDKTSENNSGLPCLITLANNPARLSSVEQELGIFEEIVPQDSQNKLVNSEPQFSQYANKMHSSHVDS